MICNVGNYCLTSIGDTVSITDARVPLNLDDDSGWTLPETTIKGFAKLIKKGVKVKLARIEDMEVIYVYAPSDGNYGYAFNLTVPYFSEWGYSPFD